MVDRIFQFIMLATSCFCCALSAGILLRFARTLGLLPSTGSAASDMIYLFVGALFGLIGGIYASIVIVKRHSYYVPHFTLVCFGLVVFTVVTVGALGRSFQVTA